MKGGVLGLCEKYENVGFLLPWGSQPIRSRFAKITVSTSLVVICFNRGTRECCGKLSLTMDIWESLIKVTTFELGLRGFEQTQMRVG